IATGVAVAGVAIAGGGTLSMAYMTMNPVTPPGGGRGGQGINLDTKPKVINDKLQGIVDKLFEGAGKPKQIGNGSQMDAVRNELATKKPTYGRFHSNSIENTIKSLQELIKTGYLDPHDTDVALALIADINKALKGIPR
nr:hypothetical protein [Anaerolineaceae bacterium]